MDLDELRSVQSKERTKDSLQHLRDSFYEDVAAYLAERKRQRDERATTVENPFSDEQVRKLSDEIETAEEVVESLYERRVGKVVKLSSFAAAGAPTDTEGMTVQEAELFEDLVVRIEQNKSRVLDVLDNGADIDIDIDAPAATADDGRHAGVGTPGAPATAESAAGTPEDESAQPQSGGVLAEAMGGEAGDGESTVPAASVDTDADTGAEAAREIDAADGDRPGPGDAGAAGVEEAGPPVEAADAGGPSEEFVPGSEPDRSGDAVPPASSTDTGGGDADTDAGADTERRTVRITRDVGQILGVDEREYELASDDVVSLPTANADPLVERDAAEPIE
ncbi:DNA replication complex subunit Gins51 [Halobaculum gomorrense]|uniref:DNA replication factor GINS n=1 Tax=Halobaculum gomorrense TaxID=43928 RepID=A0A1M5SIP7_9EURY|nr:hypothetical protein [Halobaculum gomorrense]SHH38424.1 DNA replication factor GINS [Halobaculum gomorrense]